ncbi:HigA family addiction module antidote protein [Candidatus Nomurabacteria bacterium]|nr:HigA family addiction module antidote protein [Candidatus Kaiserbacteria bacterium]MCB9814461.1 HigA family addiction module antidote protein [Candidatus Nomurabacteria bacterium]
MSTTSQTYFPSKPIHPGVSLADELDFLSLSITDVASRTGISKKHLSNIINGKASITSEVAIKLEKVTGTKASFWNSLSRNYQASLAMIEEQAHIEEEAVLENILPFKETYQELKKHGVVEDYAWVKNNFGNITQNLLNFFSVYSLKYIPNIQPVVFRRHEQKNINQNTIAAIIRLSERKAQSVQAEPFDKKALKTALSEIKSYSLLEPEEYFPKLEEKLRTLGIILVCVPGFKHTGLQGAAKWLDTDKAMVIVKSRGQEKDTAVTEDKFWFNLFHELGHLILHGKSEEFIDLDDEVDSKEEKEANAFANKQFMGGFELSDLQAYKSNQGSINADEAVKDLSKRFGIAPSIVAGQMSFLYQDKQDNVYAVLNGYKRKIQYTNCI